jgi:hypothetical protein
MRRVAWIVPAAWALGCQWVFPLHHDDAPPAAADAGDAPADAAPDDSSNGADAPQLGADTYVPDDCTLQFTPSQACNDCLSQHCCHELNECYIRNTECSNIAQCIVGCGFDFIVCPQTCENSHPAGVDAFNKANACTQVHCGMECQNRFDASTH